MQAILTNIDSFSCPKKKTESEEQVLLKRLASGDRNAFWHLWERYRDYLFCRCRTWMGGNLLDAEEALSLAMLKAWKKLPDYAAKITNLKAWLVRMVHNLCVDIHRQRQRSVRTIESIDAIAEQEDETLSSTHTPESAMLRHELEMYLRRAIKSLPNELRSPFLLRFYQKKSYADIAKQLATSEVNIRKRIQQARTLLKKQVNKYLAGLETTSTQEPISDWNELIAVPCHVEQIDYRVTVLCLETLSRSWCH
jgi:RNA polymerase sigma factor (sigma-70 family)